MFELQMVHSNHKLLVNISEQQPLQVTTVLEHPFRWVPVECSLSQLQDYILPGEFYQAARQVRSLQSC